MSDFDTFWQLYPKKLAKLDAMKAYDKARRFTSAEAILEGVRRYLEHLPDEPRFIAHAATWLRAARYEDEYDVPIVQPVQKYWAEECQEVHGGTCAKQWDHVMRMRQEKAARA